MGNACSKQKQQLVRSVKCSFVYYAVCLYIEGVTLYSVDWHSLKGVKFVIIIMDKKPNKIYENLIPMKINYFIQYKPVYIHATNTYIPYNWPALLAASWLNRGCASSYILIRICY